MLTRSKSTFFQDVLETMSTQVLNEGLARVQLNYNQAVQLEKLYWASTVYSVATAHQDVVKYDEKKDDMVPDPDHPLWDWGIRATHRPYVRVTSPSPTFGSAIAGLAHPTNGANLQAELIIQDTGELVINDKMIIVHVALTGKDKMLSCSAPRARQCLKIVRENMIKYDPEFLDLPEKLARLTIYQNASGVRVSAFGRVPITVSNTPLEEAEREFLTSIVRPRSTQSMETPPGEPQAAPIPVVKKYQAPAPVFDDLAMTDEEEEDIREMYSIEAVRFLEARPTRSQIIDKYGEEMLSSLSPPTLAQLRPE